MNRHQQWEELIQTACDERTPVLPENLKRSLKHRLFPPWGYFGLIAQLLAGGFLVAGPAVLAEAPQSGALPLPGLAYGVFGCMTLLWLVPMTWRILQRSAADLAALSDQIDAVFHLNVKRSFKSN